MRKTKKIILCLITAAALCVSAVPAAAAKENACMLVPDGEVIGIKIECSGTVVAALNEVDVQGGGVSPAFEAGIRAGDVITNINSASINSIEDFHNEMDKWDGGSITVRVLREGRQMQFNVNPLRDSDGRAALGLWLRDGMAGVGTMTYYDPATGEYGALGHGVNDIDTGILIPLRSGSIMDASIGSVIRGEKGRPGELAGSFNINDVTGSILENTPCGIFGVKESKKNVMAEKAIPVAKRSEIKTGKAKILSCINGTEAKEYEIEIARVYPKNDEGRDMLINVTDSGLLKETGGIVQGMSGSPIIQDGKLVGAVTHVLVNDPTRGYGISIEKMLEAAGKVEEQAA